MENSFPPENPLTRKNFGLLVNDYHFDVVGLEQADLANSRSFTFSTHTNLRETENCFNGKVHEMILTL